jgi:hypothetical protein
MTKAQKAWREKGSIGKLHNLIVNIRMSPQRREIFRECKIGDSDIDNLLPILYNSTRWNSTFKSLQRALLLKRRIQLFCLNRQSELDKDILQEADWKSFDKITLGLRPFHQATLRAEGSAQNGHHGAIREALPNLETLLGTLEKQQEELHKIQGKKAPQPIQVAYQIAWEKLRKYYNKTDDAHGIYAAAVRLHPKYPKHYFERKWATKELKEWKEPLYQSIKEYWEAEYHGTISRPLPPNQMTLLRQWIHLRNISQISTLQLSTMRTPLSPTSLDRRRL